MKAKGSFKNYVTPDMYTCLCVSGGESKLMFKKLPYVIFEYAQMFSKLVSMTIKMFTTIMKLHFYKVKSKNKILSKSDDA